MIPNDIEKVERDQFLTYLDTTPSETSRTWAVLGIGITDYGIAYNPQVDQEKWIIERNSRNIHKSNQKQGTVSQTIYKNDPCFEFIKNGRDKLNYTTNILDIDTFDGTTEGNITTYPAKMNKVVIAITQYMNEDATIEYDIYYDGDPIEGTVTMDENNVPTFVPNESL